MCILSFKAEAEFAMLCRPSPRDSGLYASSDIEMEVPQSPKRQNPFAADPGHMLAKLNCAGAPAAGAESAEQTRYEFSVEVALAPTIFSATKVAVDIFQRGAGVWGFQDYLPLPCRPSE